MFAGRSGRGRHPKPLPDPHARIVELVTLACESGGSAPDPELLRALKREVRADAVALRRAHDTLMDRCLRHRECGPRLHAVVIVDELFRRSRDFRDAHMERLDAFLRRAIVGRDSGADPAEDIPGPVEDADRLVSRACRALQEWNERFGAHYPRLGVALRFVDDVLGPAAPSSIAERDAREAEKREDEDRARRLARWRRCEREQLPRLRRDAGEYAVAIGECLAILLGAKPSSKFEDADGRDRDAGDGEDDDDDERWEDVDADEPEPDEPRGGRDTRTAAAALRFIGENPAGDGAQLAGNVRIAVTDDNRVVVDELRGLCRAATVRVLPGLAEALALVAGIVPAPDPSTFSLSGDGAAAVNALSSESKAAAVNALARSKRTLRVAVDRCVALGVVSPGEAGGGGDDDGAETVAATGANGGRVTGNGARPAPETTDPAGGGALTISLDDAPPLPTETSTPGEAGDGNGARGSDVDALIERARRRRARREGLARRNAAAGAGTRDGGRGTGLRGTGGKAGAGAGVTRRGGRGGGGDANASAANLAKRMLASAMREHNESVMRELGDEYTERRDEASGLAGTRRRLEWEREEAAAREAEETAKEAVRRRRRETTTKQRIEAKLKALRKKRR